MLFLGIDHTPRQLQAVVFSLESNGVVAGAARPAPDEAVPGFVTDPKAWLRAIDACVTECLGHLGSERSRLAGMTVSGHGGGVILLGRDHEVLRPVEGPHWEERGDAARALRRRFGGTPGVVELLGQSLPSNSAAVDLFRLTRSERELVDELALVHGTADFFRGWLTGVSSAELSNAAESGLLDARACKWSEVMVGEIDPRLPACLPSLSPSRELSAGLRPEVARKWGVPDHLLVAGGGSRVAGQLLGAGACTPGEVLVDLSSSGCLHLVMEEPVVDPMGQLSLRCDTNSQWFLSLREAASGTFAEEVMEQWKWDRGQLEEEAGKVAPGAGGLVFLGGAEGGTLA